jgi:hypothetical protein
MCTDGAKNTVLQNHTTIKTQNGAMIYFKRALLARENIREKKERATSKFIFLAALCNKKLLATDS